MTNFSRNWAKLLAAGFFALLMAAGLAPASGEEQKDAMRQNVGDIVTKAQSLMKDKKYDEVINELVKTDAISNKSPYEIYAIERTRGVAAYFKGDADTAAKSFDAAFATGKSPPTEQHQFEQAIAQMFINAKNYPQAIAWDQRVLKDGPDPATSKQIAQLYYISKDYPNAVTALGGIIDDAEKAGQKPAEDVLELHANSLYLQKDKANYIPAQEKLVAAYPNKKRWTDLINQVQEKPGFSTKLQLDVFRLRSALGTLEDPRDYVAMAQSALDQGYPTEAKKLLDQGYAAGVLGKGADAVAQDKLKQEAAKKSAADQKHFPIDEKDAAKAKDGNAPVVFGFNFVINGQNDKGIALMQKGLAMGGLKRPNDAKLKLAEAYWMAGQKDKALETFKQITPTTPDDGSADLARLWAIYLGQS